jgi:hypothetical protein
VGIDAAEQEIKLHLAVHPTRCLFDVRRHSPTP